LRQFIPAGERFEEEGGPSGAMQALDYWAAQRAYPNAVIPDVGFAAAWEQAQLVERTDNGIDDATAPWELLGPSNIGGRTLCLAIHPWNPDILFAGSASGGLWKTTVGGVGADAWDYVATGYPVLGVSSIAIDAQDPQVMYIGTGEVYRYQESMGGEVIRTTRGSYGIGVLKTSDGGASWSKVLDWSYEQRRGVWMIAIDPLNSSRVFAATTEGIYRSTNAGASWTLVHPVVMGTDIRINPANPAILFAACGNFGSTDHGIYRSQDGGDSWVKLTTGLPSSWTGKAQLFIAPTDPNRIFASIANEGAGRGLYRSLDGGDTWQQRTGVDYQQYQGWYSHYVVVSPFDADELYVGGIEIWRSTNGGSSITELSSWQEAYYGTSPPEGPIGGPHYAHADHHFAVWHPTDPNTVFFTSDGGIFKTTNAGQSFQSLIGGYATTQFYNGFANSATNHDRAIGGLQDNFTAIYDGTIAWRRVIGGDGIWAAINQQDDDTMYGSWQYLNMERSRNGGASWSYIAPPDQGETAFVAPYICSPSNPDVLYAGRNRVYKSTNEGTSWTTTNGGLPLNGNNPVLCLVMSEASPDTVYASTSPIYDRGRLYRTTNGGTSWQEITGILPDRYYTDLTVDPQDASILYVALMGYGSSHLFRSADAGDSWQDIGDGLPDVPATSVAVDPDYPYVDPNAPYVIYVGTDLGVFISVDGGQNWLSFQSGMPLAMVNDLKVFRPDRKLRAATHGNAAFERDLFDPTMTGVATGPSRVPGLRVFPNPVEAGTRVRFDLPRAARAKLALYDVQGRRLALLSEGEMSAGAHELPFEEATRGLSAGVYFLRLEAAGYVQNTRVVYLR